MENKNFKNDEGEIKGSKMFKLPKSILRTSRALCKINTSFTKGTGYFIKIFLKDEDFFFLMTNEHIVTKELIEERKNITFYYDFERKEKEKCFNTDERYIKDFKDLNINENITEILPKDNIDKDYFLLPYINIDYNELINKKITIIQYP